MVPLWSKPKHKFQKLPVCLISGSVIGLMGMYLLTFDRNRASLPEF